MIALIEYNAIPIAVSALLGVAAAWWAYGRRRSDGKARGDDQ